MQIFILKLYQSFNLIKLIKLTMLDNFNNKKNNIYTNTEKLLSSDKL